MLISDCCGAHITLDFVDFEICPDCGEHCEIIDEDQDEE